MTALAAAGYISDSARTEGQAKLFFEDLVAVLKEMPGGSAEVELTIAAGSVTPAASGGALFRIDTEANAATDDLTHIVQTNTRDGSLIILTNENTARTVVLKHAAGGAGQILLHGSADLSLSDTKTPVLLRRVGTSWSQVGLLPLSGGTVSGLVNLNGGANVSPAATPATNAVGYLGAPQDTVNAAYTFVIDDRGRSKFHDEATARAWTIPPAATVPFPEGTIIIVDNTGNNGAAGAITLTQGAGVTLRRGDGTAGTGNRTVPASAVAAIRKTKTNEWVLTGSFS